MFKLLNQSNEWDKMLINRAKGYLKEITIKDIAELSVRLRDTKPTTFDERGAIEVALRIANMYFNDPFGFALKVLNRKG